MKVETLIILPRGSISERILTIISAKIFAEHTGVKLSLLWDHEIAYSTLFLDRIDMITFERLQGTKYIYNPHVDQTKLYHNIDPTENETSLIVQTNNELLHPNMSKLLYLKKRTELYNTMLTRDISGTLLGQLNLFDAHYGLSTYCFADGDTTDVNRNPDMKVLPLLSKDLFDVANDDMFDYICSILYSRASLLVATKSFLPSPFLFASQISMIPLIATHPDENTDLKSLIGLVCKNILDYTYVINPDFNKISLLI